MISIIVPAHNEERVIERCLRYLVEGAKPGELEVIVVCNGCDDATAQLARNIEGPIVVFETKIRSKAKALNKGDQESRGFPRFYVDADVVVPLESIRKVAKVLECGSALVAAPTIKVNYEGCSWAVRAFYKIWLELPYCNMSMVGTGVYALSAKGRSKFDRFPDIIADDEYVRLLFDAKERCSVESCSFTVFAPVYIWKLIKIMTRSRLGRLQLFACFPELLLHENKAYLPAIHRLAMRPSLWLCFFMYAFVIVIVRLRALVLQHLKQDKYQIWERDDSSRVKDQM